ncbi:MAG TPA: transglycosylase domain-containing protein [Candidatus Paraprevotella stercorigallinarum]|nr:transglycosylase domain-containing protein [Candidatus Paraprevotella stercorigallinarum]
MRKKFIITLWVILFLSLSGIAGAFYAIWKGWIGYMPNLQQLENPVNKYASQALSSDGKLLGTWSYSRANRIFVDYENLSPWLVKALVATEDVRFYEHSGIDYRALARAIVKRVIMGQENAGGGSTITQQLAKQLYSDVAQSTMERALQKPIEWVIAVRLERYYTKEEIITMYLNYFDFLHNAVGIKTAAKTYFNKDPNNLSVCEAATLIGMCKNPSYFNPVRKPERCRDRRNVVLDQMVKAGYLTEAEARTYKEEPLKLRFHRVDHKEGIATYFRERLRTMLMAKKPNRSNYASWQGQKFYEDSLAWETDPLYGWCNKNKKKDGTPYNLYTDGLKIYTTIDSRMQKYAEDAVLKHVAGYLQPIFDKEKRNQPTKPFSNQLTQKEVNEIMERSMRQSERYIMMKKYGATESEIKKAFSTPCEMTVFSYHGEVDTIMSPMDSIRYYKGFLRAGFMCMEAKTGFVKAYVGGPDYRYFQYDMAGVGRRQVGSTIKPFLYTLAMENGMSPCDLAPNVQQTYIVAGKPWTPRNGSRSRYGEMVTLKWGLAQSNNWISAYLMSRLSPAALVRLIHEFGVLNREIHPSMSLCLGPCEISVSEMVSAYTVFANNGIRTAPLLVTRIEDNEGNVVAEFQPKMNEVISEESAYKMIIMLQGVMNGGTGSRMRFRYNVNADMGGKTGTTNRNSDGWFMAFTPSLVTGCWVGGEDRDIHFNSMTYGQGASSALPISAYFFQSVFKDARLGYSESEKFELPADFDPCETISYDEASAEEEVSGIDEIFN